MTSMSKAPRTVIEFTDTATADTERPLAHKAKEIRINGAPVLVDADSVYLEFGANDPTRLTVTIFPTEVHFNHDHESPKE